MSKTYELSYTAERIDEMLKEVDEHTIYSDATTEEHGLMSATDKTKLDALQTAQQIEVSLSEKVDKVEGKGLSTNDYTDADKAKVASALQTETDPTVPSWAKQSNKPSYDYSEIGNTPDLSGFITKSVNDLTNYYLKSDTYTKAEVAALIGAIQQFHYEIYATLPQTGEGNVLYLIGPTGSGSDRYEEYVYSNNAFTKIGDTSIDLSGYVTTSALNTALSAYTTTSDLTTLLSNKADKVSNATNGNFAGLDANGNLTDSGKKASDFATAAQGANADNAILFVEQDKLTDQQRNTALANVSNQTANSTTGKMGYKVLDPTKTFVEQVTAENTIYEIRDVFDLGGSSVTIPSGVNLVFNGGGLRNFSNIDISLSSIKELNPQDFLAAGDGVTDDTAIFRQLLKVSNQSKRPIRINNGCMYYITDSLNYWDGEYQSIRIRIVGKELRTGNIYSSSDGKQGFLVNSGISVFKNQNIYGYVKGVSFFGKTRSDAPILFDSISVVNIDFEYCLITQFEAFMKDSILKSSRINGCKMLTLYYFAKIENSLCQIIDTTVCDNYINGGAEKNDNSCFQVAYWNGSNVINNFIDYYRIVYHFTEINPSAGAGPNSIGNQYQVFRYFYWRESIVTNLRFQSISDSFNWTNPTSLSKLQTYVPLQYTDKQDNAVKHDIPPFIGIVRDKENTVIKDVKIEPNVYNGFVFELDTITQYSYSRFEFSLGSNRQDTYINPSCISLREDNSCIYNKGNSWVNSVKIEGIYLSVDTLPSFTKGWCKVVNGTPVVYNGIRYIAKNIPDPTISGNENFTPKWCIEDKDYEESRHKGTTNNRPTLTSTDAGFQYFDTTLGKYICWNGTSWVNLDGTALS